MHSEDTLMMDPLTPEPTSGDTVGGYLLGKMLGRGANGVVYLAEKPGNPKPFALKLISTEGHAQAFVDRVLRECAITTKLRHPSIITVYEAGRIGSHIYIVMEVAAGSACDHFTEGRLGWELATQIVIRVAQALDYAYNTARIIHRDIKPANIVIDLKGGTLAAVKVVDFGLSRSIEEDGAGLTMTGMVLGTPFYMSPEQARGERDLSFHTDLYALGATLFFLIAGRPPFHSGSPVEILLKHCNEAPPKLATIKPSCPPKITEIIDRCLAKDRQGRFKNFSDLIASLQDTLKDNPFDQAIDRANAFVHPISSSHHKPQTETYGQGSQSGNRSASSSGSDALGELFRAKLEETTQVYRRRPAKNVPVAENSPPPPPASVPTTVAPVTQPKKPAPRVQSLANGTLFDRHYTITGTLGSGAMGEVFSVIDTFTGNELALKILSVEDMQRPGAVRRFRGEASALANIDHPAFPYFAGKGTYLGRDYLLMEKVVGTDLKTWLNNNGGRMSEDGALIIMRQLAQAMDRAYAKCGMVHRDIKPANLMLTKGDVHQVKIVDFGVSTYIDFGDFEDFSNREYHYIDDDSQGRSIGTPAFMSPEQCLGKPPSPMMDIYAIGCTFFQLLTGRTLYQAPNPSAMMMKHLQEPPPLMTAAVADVSSGSQYLLKKCLAKNPRERFQNYKSLEAAIDSAGHSLTSKLKRQGTGLFRRQV